MNTSASVTSVDIVKVLLPEWEGGGWGASGVKGLCFTFHSPKFQNSRKLSMSYKVYLTYNRPFYRYGGHLEFRGNYGMPRGQMRNN